MSILNSKEHIVDFRVFYKNAVEKAHAHTVKKQWKTTMKLFYGDNWRKYNNFPESLKDN